MERFNIREQEAVAEVIRSGELSRFFISFYGGKHVQSFETEFAEYLGVKHAISVTNGTVALEIALAAAGIGRGDSVLVTPLTFIASATAIKRVGATPIFVDIDPETLNMDEEIVEDSITRKTRAILSVSLLGMPANMTRLRKLADDWGLLLIEDAAQSLGATWDHKKIGAWGDLATFSFQESKSLTTLGEGGMIVTNRDDLADLCRHIRNHGNTYGPHQLTIPCTNARLTEAAAAFGRVQLQKYPGFVQQQRQNAEELVEYIRDPLHPVYNRPMVHCSGVYYLLPLALGDNSRLTRDEFIAKCTEAGISRGLPGQNIGYYKRLVSEAAIFHDESYRRKKPHLPNAEWARDHVLLFDVHRWHRREQMREYAETFNRILSDF